ncbi:hypothetical protein HX109_05535 [Galbibacter sp. BG1]|uniref:hypothetical protein n=1 Tax=Galbibacter sp. BG1 TaxID=1170699 RepID=UPI0015B8532B|nr:hypothetical protein [Galbibacter sp. BG1]QLE01051.1 hypothetical protein HX109_05535 [Galbibacter sp. BG1]
MKKCIYTLLAIALLGLFSCSGDDDGGDSRDCKECDALVVSGEKSQLCDNGDGTYTLTYPGGSEDFELEDGEDFEEAFSSFCGGGIPSL